MVSSTLCIMMSIPLRLLKETLGMPTADSGVPSLLYTPSFTSNTVPVSLLSSLTELVSIGVPRTIAALVPIMAPWTSRLTHSLCRPSSVSASSSFSLASLSAFFRFLA